MTITRLKISHFDYLLTKSTSGLITQLYIKALDKANKNDFRKNEWRNAIKLSLHQHVFWQ